MIGEVDIAYIAGLFDGEGSIQIRRGIEKKKRHKGKPGYRLSNSMRISMEITMTDITKYRNVSLTHETYKTLISLSKVLLPDAQLSISKTIESIANEKAKKLNGKMRDK